MWYSNECKLVLIAYLWSCLIILKVKTENHKHFQNCIVEGTGSSLWDNIQDITESELGLLALILLPVLPSFIHDFGFLYWPLYNGWTLWDYKRLCKTDPFVWEVFPWSKLQFMNACRLHPRFSPTSKRQVVENCRKAALSSPKNIHTRRLCIQKVHTHWMSLNKKRNGKHTERHQRTFF